MQTSPVCVYIMSLVPNDKIFEAGNILSLCLYSTQQNDALLHEWGS